MDHHIYIYTQWSAKFSAYDCVKDPPKTQGIVEFHQKSVKHINIKSDDAMSNYVCDMTLHHPDIAVNESELIEQSIKGWALGLSSKALISCKGVFNENPEHEEYISKIDKNNPIIRCSGWRSPLNIGFVTKPPFLVFDISAEFANDVKDLSRIPYEISVYGDKYSFAGVTSFVRRHEHFVGYISLENNRILLYDGLPATNLTLQIYPRAAIQGDISQTQALSRPPIAVVKPNKVETNSLSQWQLRRKTRGNFLD